MRCVLKTNDLIHKPDKPMNMTHIIFILHPLRFDEASASSSLSRVHEMCAEDGPPLSLGGHLCWYVYRVLRVICDMY